MGLTLLSAIYVIGVACFYVLAAATAQAEPMSVAQLRVIENDTDATQQRAA